MRTSGSGSARSPSTRGSATSFCAERDRAGEQAGHAPGARLAAAAEGAALTYQVTDTAIAIARFRAEESERPETERLFDDPYARLFAGGTSADAITAQFLSVPFFREHVRLRTRLIDDVVREAIADGVRQIVIPGAGFDCRALRLGEVREAGARVFEIDYAAQLGAKRAALVEAGVRIPETVRHVPCDFTAPDWEHSLGRDLEGQGFEAARPTTFVYEGIIGYLSEGDLARTLAWIRRVGAVGSAAVFNYALARLQPEQFREAVVSAGLGDLEDVSLAKVWPRYLRGDPPPGGELYRIATLRL